MQFSICDRIKQIYRKKSIRNYEIRTLFSITFFFSFDFQQKETIRKNVSTKEKLVQFAITHVYGS